MGACAALSVVVPPLAGLLNVVGTLTLVALAAYAGYRGWAWMESIVEASRRPATVRRNREESAPGRAKARQRDSDREVGQERSAAVLHHPLGLHRPAGRSRPER